VTVTAGQRATCEPLGASSSDWAGPQALRWKGGGAQRWEQISPFHAAAWVSGAIWALKGRPGLLESVVLAGDSRDQRLTITPLPWPGRHATWEPYRQAPQTTDGVLAAGREPAPSPGDPGLAAR
jgi:hypothetical protein